MDFKSIVRRLIMEQDETKLTNYYNSLVTPKEGKKNGLIDFKTFKTLVLADPTTKKHEDFDAESATYEDMVEKRVQPGKYANWLLKNYVKPNAADLEQFGDTDPKSPNYKKTIQDYRERYLEDLFGVTIGLKDFTKIKQYIPVEKRDVGKLTPNELKMLMDELPQKAKDKLGYAKVAEKKSSGDAKDPRVRFDYPGSDIIHIGPKYTVIKIEGVGDAQKKAATWFGGKYKYNEGESHWCTSPEGSNAFMTYVPSGPLYVIMANDDKGLVGAHTNLPQERFQFHFPKEQFMDRMDNQIKVPQFLDENPDLKELFKPIWAKELVVPNTKKVEINYPQSGNGGVSRYIAIYGFDELFEKLPDDIQYLLIQNTSKESFEMDIPESIGRFKNVQALMLTNMVKSLPESIGEMTNLQFLTLSDNKNLKELPESLADLPKLSFLTLRNVPDLVIPPRLAEKLTQEGNGFYYVA